MISGPGQNVTHQSLLQAQLKLKLKAALEAEANQAEIFINNFKVWAGEVVQRCACMASTAIWWITP